MLKRILGYTIALVALFAVSSGIAFAATISPFTGPAGTNPVQEPINLPDLNALVQSLQTNTVGGTGTLSAVVSVPATNGQLQFTNAGSYPTILASTNGVLTLSAARVPAGLNSTVLSQFLVFTDSNGRLSYIPFWQ